MLAARGRPQSNYHVTVTWSRPEVESLHVVGSAKEIWGSVCPLQHVRGDHRLLSSASGILPFRVALLNTRLTASKTRFCSRSCSEKGTSWLSVPVRKRGRSKLNLLAHLWPNVIVKSNNKGHTFEFSPENESNVRRNQSLMSHFYYFRFLLLKQFTTL